MSFIYPGSDCGSPDAKTRDESTLGPVEVAKQGFEGLTLDACQTTSCFWGCCYLLRGCDMPERTNFCLSSGTPSYDWLPFPSCKPTKQNRHKGKPTHIKPLATASEATWRHKNSGWQSAPYAEASVSIYPILQKAVVGPCSGGGVEDQCSKSRKKNEEKTLHRLTRSTWLPK